MKKVLLSVLLALIVVVAPITTINVSARSVYSNYINARTISSGLNIQPTAVMEVSDFADIPTGAKLMNSGITSLIFTPDDQMNITLGAQTMGFSQVFDTYIKGLFIPVLRLDKNTVTAFINMMNSNYYIKDIMVISSDIEVLQTISEQEICSVVNTVYDLQNVKIPQNRYDLWQYIAKSNVTYTNILMFDGNDTNLAIAAEYLSSMCKVTWATCDDYISTVNAISCGVYGVVTTNSNDFANAMTNFKKQGFTKAQNVGAHRGITSYANENSLTAVAGAINEGATHAEIDIQLTRDGEILLCHDMVTTQVSETPNVYFEPTLSSYIRTLKLNDYSSKYDETFPTLEEVIDIAVTSDLILIIELKLEDARTTIINKQPIEKFLNIMRSHPEMDGKWFCITFFRPFADKMRELAPEIPVGFLGGATSGYELDQGIAGWDGEWAPIGNISSKIAFMHKFKTLLDETYETSSDQTMQTYLARGYVQNGWTFKDLSHFKTRLNIATSDVSERCAMLIKKIIPTQFTISESQLSSGKLTVLTQNYNGWTQERVCDIIPISREGNTVKFMLYYLENADGYNYGLYSQLLTYEII